MAATFPGGVKVFTTKQAGDQIASAHINDLQAEVVAVETELRKTTGSVVDHGSLAGLSDNDHPQYLLTTGKAADSDKLDGVDSTGFVNMSSAQTIGGIKTFSSFPVTPSSAPTSNYQVANKKYVDDNAGGVSLLDVYPIGSIYISTASTNPSTFFGGTWVAYSQGRVLVGKATSGTFATAGATGGEETHSLTVAELASHSHTTEEHTHAVPLGLTTDETTAMNNTEKVAAGPANQTSTASLNVSSASPSTNSTGSGSAHNNLQPYIVVYMWERTE